VYCWLPSWTIYRDIWLFLFNFDRILAIENFQKAHDFSTFNF
jgi:hypothetical protein